MTSVDSIDTYTTQIAEFDGKIEEERQRVKAEASKLGDVNMDNGFVTFNRRSDAMIAQGLELSHDKDEWIVSTPPAPADIIWSDCQQDSTATQGWTLSGYAMVAGLYFAYLPMVVGMTNIANMINMGPLQPLWASIAPTLGLTVMVGFLPTFLMTITGFCFTLKAAAWAQSLLQNWYFWFQLVFVVLVTAIGQNIVGFTETLVSDPFAVFGVLADTMPYATHFYMNFIVLQWVAHVLNLTRYVVLMKFKSFSKIFAEEDALKMAEPEDQDYYGIGGRSARWAINLSIGIIYGTLSPPICVLTWVNFALSRLIYGYLIPFAETKKADLGGVFWVKALHHLFVANVVYCILMTGVLMHRAATYGPMLITAPTIIYVLVSFRRFRNSFSWEHLPLQELVVKKYQKEVVVRESTGQYIQPELLEK